MRGFSLIQELPEPDCLLSRSVDFCPEADSLSPLKDFIKTRSWRLIYWSLGQVVHGKATTPFIQLPIWLKNRPQRNYLPMVLPLLS